MYFHQYATAFCFFFHATATTEIYTHLHPLALHDALPISAFMDIGTTTPILATLLGLAVGIAYTLFILARSRNELEHTDDREEAIGVAVGTAGSAVVFSGLTVLIALSPPAAVGIPFLTSFVPSAAGPLQIALPVPLTTLPATLGLLQTQSLL